MSMDEMQRAQELEYDFPYHYVARRTARGLRLSHTWSWGFRYIAALDYLLAKMRTLSFTSAIDIGCGDGRFIAEVARAFPDVHTMGIDYSERAIAMARAMNPTLAFERLDLTTHEYPKTFDLLTSIEVLEHIPPSTLPAFVAGMRRLAHPRSKLLLTVPHVNQTLAAKHYQHFDQAKLESTLAPHFRVESVEYIDRKSKLVNYVERAIVNNHFAITNERLLGILETAYLRKMFRASPDSGMRMVALCAPV